MQMDTSTTLQQATTSYIRFVGTIELCGAHTLLDVAELWRVQHDLFALFDVMHLGDSLIGEQPVSEAS